MKFLGNRAIATVAMTCGAMILASCGGSDDPATAPAPTTSAGTIKVLSNRPDLVSAGDALVEIVPASGVDAASLKVDLGGKDMTSAFAVRDSGRYLGLVTGMTVGANTLNVKASSGATASLTLTNHANGGPVLYGPQVAPWGCDSGALDAQCNRPTTYAYLYKSTDPLKTTLLPFNPAAPATDVATTTTDAGVSVPFVVRVETGVIDRDYYNIAVLFDAKQAWQPWKPQAAWNRKVVYSHGAGYGMGYNQLNTISGANVLNVYALSRGFAVMSTALNDTGHDGNVAVQAEAMMMLREHFIESYGEIRYSIGVGQSGGALAQYWVANAYPGIYDGLVVGYSFPDAGTAGIEIEDCALLKKYFNDPSKWSAGMSWSTTEQRAVAGQLGDSCQAWVNSTARVGLPGDMGYPSMWNPSDRGAVVTFPGISPTAFGACDVPISALYNPTFNPTGVRCSAQDYVVGLMGRRPGDGFANRPYANVGVQYGLKALTAGVITPAQFADLNSKIGSHSIDYAFQAYRTAADAPAVAASYRTGWINAANGLATVPILDIRVPDTSTNHHHFRSWAMRDRLEKAQGHHKNQVIWFNSTNTPNQALDAMDAWVAAIKGDTSSQALNAKVISNRPASLTDLCGTQDGTTMTMLQCTGGLDDGSPRVAAGGPVSDDVLDCKLAPLDRTKFAVTFDDSQWAALQQAFPTGICDYSTSGTGQQATIAWQTYLNSDGSVLYGGAPLPAVP